MVAEFVAELCRLSEHCSYGNLLGEILQDRLVCGIGDTRVQRCLLAETDLTFKKAFELAWASELAEKNARDLQRQSSHPPNVNFVSKQPELFSTAALFSI